MATGTALLLAIHLINLALSIGCTNSIPHTRSINPGSDPKVYELKSALTDSLAKGAELAMEECKDQFKWDRWNCPESAFSRKSTVPVTREMAFVSAITSAGIVYSVTRSCAQGDLTGCGCNRAAGGYPARQDRDEDDVDEADDDLSEFNARLRTRLMETPQARSRLKEASQVRAQLREVAQMRTQFKEAEQAIKQLKEDTDDRLTLKEASTWSWNGCSDNVQVGEKVADLFLGALEHGSADINSQTNIHNYKLGKAVVRESMRKECKCHGVSGSCSVQSCWRRVANFRQVGEALKKRYNRAIRVEWNAARLTKPNIPETSMVFLADSPDYCKANIASGWEGTAGRVCSRAKGGTRSERRSCRELCRSCGHQVRRRTIQKTKLCNCTFQWCCKVTCSKCTNTVQELYCDATPLPYLNNY